MPEGFGKTPIESKNEPLTAGGWLRHLSVYTLGKFLLFDLDS